MEGVCCRRFFAWGVLVLVVEVWLPIAAELPLLCLFLFLVAAVDLAMSARFCTWGVIISVLLMNITSNYTTTPGVITLGRGCQYARSARFREVDHSPRQSYVALEYVGR